MSSVIMLTVASLPSRNDTHTEWCMTAATWLSTRRGSQSIPAGATEPAKPTQKAGCTKYPKLSLREHSPPPSADL
eukprot:3962712-Amphidinium_carterae.1